MAETDQHAAPADILQLTTKVVSAYVGNNPVPATELGGLINSVYSSFLELREGPLAEPQKPAVPIKKSVLPDYLVCLEDGKRLKMLKRHLRTTYGLTPEEYRAKWNLPPDYPMVAPSYAEQRSRFAKAIGLGKKAPAKRTRQRVQQPNRVG